MYWDFVLWYSKFLTTSLSLYRTVILAQSNGVMTETSVKFLFPQQQELKNPTEFLTFALVFFCLFYFVVTSVKTTDLNKKYKVKGLS